jgi:hypothetical protein
MIISRHQLVTRANNEELGRRFLARVLGRFLGHSRAVPWPDRNSRKASDKAALIRLCHANSPKVDAGFWAGVMHR